ncbi:1,3-beta-galactosyl-N-acetylhexosamine phosphorylase [Natronospora cellulosivora (SeqCode)]
MNKEKYKRGDFTLPGEAGYEDLTLELAQRWGADVIRDSDGTVLSDKILSMDFDIYSTLCLVRADNEWAKNNRDKLQQNFLMTEPVIAEEDTVEIRLLDGYFDQQFEVNFNDDPKEWWQVFDRTSNKEVPVEDWQYDQEKGTVIINSVEKWHKYTVNFLAYRVWEAISMYNHITNDWGDREHQMPIDPIYPEAQEHILKYLEKWLKEHPNTDVVRFTSMFYNFTWFWGDDPNLRFRYADWGSYDFTVSPQALREFEKEKGYRLESEDFVNQGKHNLTHNVPSERYREWMDFVNSFVVRFGRECTDLVHKYNKKAYVFYDDHWVGIEPYGKRFKDLGFDGIIKCVFNGFEARKCAGVETDVHELRLHPYLFPTGLTGEPTFKEGGDPTTDCKNFWVNIRRALIRKPVDRIGLGGYLHLVQPFPDFVDYVEELTEEFRFLKELHNDDKAYTAPYKVAILTAWGSLRSWICSGHMHEHPELELNHIIEALSGLPVDVEFISFDDILNKGIDDEIKVIINAGHINSAWSGGSNWDNPQVVEKLTKWVAEGGGFIGVGEPSATYEGSQYFQMSHVLGVDREIGQTISHNRYEYTKLDQHFILEDLEEVDFDKDNVDNIYVLGKNTEVLLDENNSPKLTVNNFLEGKGVYLSGFKFKSQNVRLLHRAIAYAASGEKDFNNYLSTNIYTEAAYYPNSKNMVVINNSDQEQKTIVYDASGNSKEITVAPYGKKVIKMA